MIIKTSKKYIKDFKNTQLSLAHKTLLNIFINALRNDNKNIPTKKLKGEWLGYSSFRLSFDLRIIFKCYDEEVELVRIGTHNQLYKYK
ncbi:type II toxin-antitoxin system YafQ family toxin [Sulfurimonas sp.]|uniref:type II toxin-antitoxin system RelE/ParE family toxin n=1 Tax=Sulfurimonas sp. TaxID=2022749 RepID=UPI0035676BE1